MFPGRRCADAVHVLEFQCDSETRLPGCFRCVGHGVPKGQWECQGSKGMRAAYSVQSTQRMQTTKTVEQVIADAWMALPNQTIPFRHDVEGDWYISAPLQVGRFRLIVEGTYAHISDAVWLMDELCIEYNQARLQCWR